MDTRRQADSLAVSNLTVGTDCSTAVISDCQTMALCSLNCDDTPRDDGGRWSGGARGTMAYQQFDGLVDPQNSTGLVKLVSTNQTGCIYPNSTGPAVEGMGPVAAQDFQGLVDPISISKVSDNVHNISTSPQNFSNPPRALQTCALGDPTRYLPLSIGDGKFSDKNLHDPGLTPRGKKLSSSLALKNDDTHVFSHY